MSGITMSPARHAEGYGPPGLTVHTVILPIVPVSKPRQTRRDQWLTPPRPAVAAYRAFADRVRHELAREGIVVPSAGLSVRFELPMPVSWSRGKRNAMRGQPHAQKPDLDNLTKALLDAALPHDDSGVWHLASLEKRWADVGAIVLTMPLHGYDTARSGSGSPERARAVMGRRRR